MSATPQPTSSKSLLSKLLIPLVALVILIGGWLMLRPGTVSSDQPQATFTLLSGEKLALSALKGKVTIVNFWATSCTTCVHEMPQMVETYEKLHSKGLEFIAVAMKYDPPMYVKNFAETRKLPFKVAMDSDGSVAKAFQSVQLTPTTFVLDKHGEVIRKYVGEPDWKAFQELLEQSIKDKA